VIPQEPDQAGARRALGLQDADEVVAILPGSRRFRDPVPGPELLSGGLQVRRARAGVRFVTPAAPGLKAAIEQAAARRRPHGRPAVRRRPVAHRAGGLRRDADRQRHGDAGAALFKRPMVIAYDMNWLTPA
jgi:lipid-A-disaccharide synthase